MKKSLFLLSAWAISNLLTAQNFVPTDQGSAVKFKVKNLGFTITGSFTGLQGAVQFDPNDLSKSLFDVSVDASTVNSGIDMRDDHLRGEDYFDVKNYPRIRFVSTRVTPSNKKGTLYMFGKLTIKNVTQDISFPFTATQVGEGYMFKGEFTIKRRDFGVGGSSPVSNEVILDLSVFVKK